MSDSKTPPPSASTSYRDMVDRLRVHPLRLRDLEKAAVEAALQACEMNVAQASRVLGIGRTTFYRKMKLYGVP